MRPCTSLHRGADLPERTFDLWGAIESLVCDLSRAGDRAAAEALEDALRGGATGTEILLDLHEALRRLKPSEVVSGSHLTGRIDACLAYIHRAVQRGGPILFTNDDCGVDPQRSSAAC